MHETYQSNRRTALNLAFFYATVARRLLSATPPCGLWPAARSVALQIALPLGFTSSIKACLAVNTQAGSTKTLATQDTAKKAGTVVAGTLTNTTTNTKIVPVELPPIPIP